MEGRQSSGGPLLWSPAPCRQRYGLLLLLCADIAGHQPRSLAVVRLSDFLTDLMIAIAAVGAALGLI